MSANAKSQEGSGVFPFSALYVELKEILKSSCENIFILMQDRARRYAIESSSYSCGPWIRDDELQTKLIALKSWAEVVSKSCTKLTIIVTKAPTASNISSLLVEFCSQVTSFVGSYMSLTECSFGNPLFVLISTKVRGELLQVTDLVSVLSKGALTNANTATGMVWKTCENVQTLPLSNKAGYRRNLMEKISVIKDTVREFEEYLEAAKAKVDNMINDLNIDGNDDAGDAMEEDNADGDEDKEEEEDNDREDGYEISEIPTVEESIALMTTAMEALKTGLSVMTLVADKNSRAPTAVPTVFAAATASATATSIPSDYNAIGDIATLNNQITADTDGYTCNRWVSDISALSDAIESDVTDFGAELYPPLNAGTMDTLRSAGEKLKHQVLSYILLLQKKSDFLEESKNLTATLLESFQTCVHQSKTLVNH